MPYFDLRRLFVHWEESIGEWAIPSIDDELDKSSLSVVWSFDAALERKQMNSRMQTGFIICIYSTDLFRFAGNIDEEQKTNCLGWMLSGWKINLHVLASLGVVVLWCRKCGQSGTMQTFPLLGPLFNSAKFYWKVMWSFRVSPPVFLLSMGKQTKTVGGIGLVDDGDREQQCRSAVPFVKFGHQGNVLSENCFVG